MSFSTLKNCWINHFEKVAEDGVDDIYSQRSWQASFMLATKRPACREMMEMCAVCMSERWSQAPASTTEIKFKISSRFFEISVVPWRKHKSEVFVAICSLSCK